MYTARPKPPTPCCGGCGAGGSVCRLCSGCCAGASGAACAAAKPCELVLGCSASAGLHGQSRQAGGLRGCAAAMHRPQCVLACCAPGDSPVRPCTKVCMCTSVEDRIRMHCTVVALSPPSEGAPTWSALESSQSFESSCERACAALRQCLTNYCTSCASLFLQFLPKSGLLKALLGAT